MANNDEMLEALQFRNEALQVKIEALQIKIEALELKNQHLQLLHEAQLSMQGMGGEETGGGEEGATGRKRGRRTRMSSAQLNKIQTGVDVRIREILTGENYNRATYRALTGIMVALHQHGTANVNLLHEYIGGSRVTIVRHTGLMKKLGLLVYTGSRKKGFYELTDKGKALLEDVLQENNLATAA